MPIPISIAIIEDDSRFREAVTSLLSGHGNFSCLGAWSNGEDALEALGTLRPDVVLMDINLPLMSGIECTARLKASQPAASVLMLTVYEDTERIFSALKAGASGYLLKRSSPAEIAQAIRDVLEGGAPMTSQIARKVVQSFRAPVASTAEMLTPREEEILQLASQGYITKEIADRLEISFHTARTHLKNIYEKLHVRSRTEAVIRYLK